MSGDPEGSETERERWRPNPLDADILTLLRGDARMTNTEIAGRLSIAEGTVRNRIARMVQEKVIKFGCWADPLKIGYQTYAFIEIQVDPPEVENVANRLAELPEMVFVGLCTGSFDIHAAALFSSNEHMYEFITKRLNHVAGVTRTSTSNVMRIVKREFEYAVPGASVSAAAPPAPKRQKKTVMSRARGNGARLYGHSVRSDQ